MKYEIPETILQGVLNYIGSSSSKIFSFAEISQLVQQLQTLSKIEVTSEVVENKPLAK